MKIYRILAVNVKRDQEFKVGELVFQCTMNDYGLASEDSRNTGIEYISITKNSTGGYPCSTFPLKDLELIGA